MEEVLDGAEFKDTTQLSQLQHLLDIVHDIHQLESDCVRMSPLPHPKQNAQTGRIDAVNVR
jgi:hypothetical protein